MFAEPSPGLRARVAPAAGGSPSTKVLSSWRVAAVAFSPSLFSPPPPPSSPPSPFFQASAPPSPPPLPRFVAAFALLPGIGAAFTAPLAAATLRVGLLLQREQAFQLTRLGLGLRRRRGGHRLRVGLGLRRVCRSVDLRLALVLPLRG